MVSFNLEDNILNSVSGLNSRKTNADAKGFVSDQGMEKPLIPTQVVHTEKIFVFVFDTVCMFK